MATIFISVSQHTYIHIRCHFILLIRIYWWRATAYRNFKSYWNRYFHGHVSSDRALIFTNIYYTHSLSRLHYFSFLLYFIIFQSYVTFIWFIVVIHAFCASFVSRIYAQAATCLYPLKRRYYRSVWFSAHIHDDVYVTSHRARYIRFEGLLYNGRNASTCADLISLIFPQDFFLDIYSIYHIYQSLLLPIGFSLDILDIFDTSRLHNIERAEISFVHVYAMAIFHSQKHGSQHIVSIVMHKSLHTW